MNGSPLRCALIGAGRIGRLHARHLARRCPDTTLAVVVDPDREAARRCAEEAGPPRPEVAAEPEAVFARSDLRAVLVCSPTSTHVDLIRRAADAGLDVFCEKPIDPDPGRIVELLEGIADRDVRLQVGFNRRFDPSYARIRRAVEDGEVGDPHLLHLVSRDPEPPPIEYVRGSGGLFLDMAIHDFDMARFLVGSEVRTVFARAEVRVDPEIGRAGDVDTACTVLTFEDGTIGTIDNSRQAVYGYDQRAEVFGSAGSIETENRYPNTATLRTEESVRRDRPLRFFLERYRESYLAELRAFLESVRADRPVAVDGRDGLWPVVMARAAERSLEEDRPIAVDEILSPSGTRFLAR